MLRLDRYKYMDLVSAPVTYTGINPLKNSLVKINKYIQTDKTTAGKDNNLINSMKETNASLAIQMDQCDSLPVIRQVHPAKLKPTVTVSVPKLDGPVTVPVEQEEVGSTSETMQEVTFCAEMSINANNFSCSFTRS